MDAEGDSHGSIKENVSAVAWAVRVKLLNT